MSFPTSRRYAQRTQLCRDYLTEDEDFELVNTVNEVVVDTLSRIEANTGPQYVEEDIVGQG